jgi:hypothetical protein
MLVLVFVVTISGCCFDCRNDNGPTYLMDQDFKDFVLFPSGSYWVYTNNAGSMDSLYLYFQETRIDKSHKIYPFNHEGFTQNLSSSFYKDTLFGGGGAMKNYDTILFTYNERYISNSSVTGLQFYNKKKPGSVLDYAEDSKVKYIGVLSGYYVNGVQYSDVKVFENFIAADVNLSRKIYYVKGIGVIRKELFNGQEWDLKRYHINK